MVVIVNGNQVAEFQVTSKTGSFTGNTLHSTSVTEDDVGVVGEEIVAGLVKDGGGVRLGNGKANSVGETLAQRTGGDLDSRSAVCLGVAGGFAVKLLRGELLELEAIGNE